MKKLRSIVGSNIQRLRHENGHSQEHLARLLKLNKQSVWRMEAGRTDISCDTMDELAKIYNIEAATLAVPPETTISNKAISNQYRLITDAEGYLDKLQRSLKSIKETISLQDLKAKK
jgi:transcriptional regulator with XRE-family HTH domain